MTSIVINSDLSLQSALGALRDLYREHHYVKVSAKGVRLEFPAEIPEEVAA